MLKMMCTVVLTASLTAFAQDVEPAGFSLWPFLKGLLTPGNVAGALTTLAALLGGLKLLESEVRKRRIAKAVYYAFHIAEDLGNEIEGDDVFDKGAAALKALNDYCLAKKWRAPKPGEVEVAKLEFSALHGEQVEKVKIVEAAAIAQVNAATVVPPKS